MGNIGVEMNWGHAEDYLEMQWLILHLYVKDWIRDCNHGLCQYQLGKCNA